MGELNLYDMTPEEAITRIKDHMEVYKLNETHNYYMVKALNMAIKALENMGCGCNICLTHHDMRCPKIN